jgi:hypothetical protein
MYADSDSPQVSEEGCDFSCSRFACYMITFPTSFHRFPPKIDRESFRIQSEQQLISGCSGFLQCSFEHGEVKCLLYTNLDQGLLQLKMQLLSMNIDPPPRLCLLLALPPSKPFFPSDWQRREGGLKHRQDPSGWTSRRRSSSPWVCCDRGSAKPPPIGLAYAGRK